MAERLKVLASGIVVSSFGALVTEVNKTDDIDLTSPGGAGGNGDFQVWKVFTTGSVNQKGIFQVELLDSAGDSQGLGGVPFAVGGIGYNNRGVSMSAVRAGGGGSWPTEAITDFKGLGGPSPWPGDTFTVDVGHSMLLASKYLMSAANYATASLVIRMGGKYATGQSLEIWSGYGSVNDPHSVLGTFNPGPANARAYKAVLEGHGPVEFTIPLSIVTI